MNSLPFGWDFEIIKAMTDKDKLYLSGQLLLAMPAVGDPRFHKAVILICAHDAKGAMGISLNQPLPGLDFAKLIEQFDIKLENGGDNPLLSRPVMCGGPVENARGFLLHSREFVTNDTIKVSRDFSVSGTLAALKAAAEGRGPRNVLFALGYAGWGVGQLESEIQDNAWLTTPATEELVFNTEPEMMWDRAMAHIGIDPAMLSSVSGRA